MFLNYTNRQLEIFAVNIDSLNTFHSSSELYDFIDKMDSNRLQLGNDMIEWKLTSNRQFSVKSCYDFLNDGGLHSKYQVNIWKTAVPLKVKVFDWLATHDKILSKERLDRRGWTGSQICEICGFHVESNSHIFLQCPFTINIWDFFLSDTANILDTHISNVFSLFQFSKFNVTQQC